MLRSKSVIVVDDSDLSRAGVKYFLKSPDIRAKDVREASTGVEGLGMARDRCPDIMVVDLAMPGLSGIELIHTLKKEGIPAKIIVMSANGSATSINLARAAGADAFATKDSTYSEFTGALSKLTNSEYCPKLNSNPDELSYQLSDTQIAVLRMIAEGFGTKDIAKSIGLTPKGVEWHRARLRSILGISANVADYVRSAVQLGIVSPNLCGNALDCADCQR